MVWGFLLSNENVLGLDRGDSSAILLTATELCASVRER